MAVRVEFKIEGLQELDEALVGLAEEFAVRNAKSVLLSSLKDGGKIIAHAGQANAPVRSGKLAESYVVSTKLSRRQRQQRVKESAIEIFVGPTPHPKSVQTEFGNSHQAAHPHLRPAWDSNSRRVLDLIIRRISERLEETRARLVKRRAKAAGLI